MALTKDRATPRRANVDFSDPVAAGEEIHAGAIVMLNASGNAVKGAVATNLVARGVAQAHIDNVNGADGAMSVPSMKGLFRFNNAGSVTRAHIGDTAYVVDDETVAETNGGSTRSALGEIKDVDALGVWVEIA
ncbi:hypothetical protein tloyanaT_26210 [Thalassotalea loyana]|uniref:DUF2190 family protein n=1 Tax=Thalassotalea loyana TaxID=280483 RepID=A0ABQ6HE57_9GAMM|nr:hypothetical protein [Thalassotalea loyana]GLX86368.1 hypothetical protein tloyanaT_26210 [Thalassotalea loyana]